MVRTRMTVSSRLWPRVKVVYGMAGPGVGGLEGFLEAPSSEGIMFSITFWSVDGVAEFGTLASTIFSR